MQGLMDKTVAFRLSWANYRRVFELAEQRGHIRGERVNLSPVFRDLVETGLEVVTEAEDTRAETKRIG